MIFKSLKSRRGENASASVIVFLMMALVFVPVMAAHVAVVWQDQLPSVGPQQLAAIVNAILPAF
jgi:hypothetical protein